MRPDSTGQSQRDATRIRYAGLAARPVRSIRTRSGPSCTSHRPPSGPSTSKRITKPMRARKYGESSPSRAKCSSARSARPTVPSGSGTRRGRRRSHRPGGPRSPPGSRPARRTARFPARLARDGRRADVDGVTGQQVEAALHRQLVAQPSRSPGPGRGRCPAPGCPVVPGDLGVEEARRAGVRHDHPGLGVADQAGDRAELRQPLPAADPGDDVGRVVVADRVPGGAGHLHAQEVELVPAGLRRRPAELGDRQPGVVHVQDRVPARDDEDP